VGLPDQAVGKDIREKGETLKGSDFVGGGVMFLFLK
jgi:hypothetical protein